MAKLIKLLSVIRRCTVHWYFIDDVWLHCVQQLSEAELRQRIPKDEPQPSKSQISKQETAEKLYLKGQDHLDEDSPEVDIHNVSLWSSNEIAVLRKVFSAARSENTRLQASLNIAQERIGKLDRLVKKRTSTLEEKVNVLSEATKANARLQMVTNSLKKDLDQAYVVNDGIEEDLKELRSENTDLRRELHEVRSDMESERIRRQNVEIDLSDQRSEAQRQIHLREESLALRHNSKVAALKKQLQEVREELQKERKDHDRTKRGLDHLRNHFSALPYKDHGQHQGMVTKDELQKWTYWLNLTALFHYVI